MSFNKPILVVTGAAGMIGSCVVRYLNDTGRTNLLLVDDLKSGEKWKNLVGKQFLDLISRHTLFDWLKEQGDSVEAIIHLGACSDTVETNADYLLENNYRYTIGLAAWALERNVRFIYASSAATYGDGSHGFSDDEALLESLRPINMYAYSKHLADLWMKQNGVLNKVVGLKYFNVFGPNEYHKGQMASMVLKMSHIADKEGAVQLYKSNDLKFGHGEQCRDFIYVKDAARMTCAFLDRPELNGIFNIGQGKPTTWNELAEALFFALQKEPRIHYIDMPLELSRQYQNYTCAEMGKFFKISPSTTPLREAVGDYVQNYLMASKRW